MILLALAEDHTMLRQMLKQRLDAVSDFEVMYDAPNGAVLLKCIESGERLPDICILDVSMPVMNGYDTLLALKNRFPSIKVLVLTMIDHQGNFVRMLNAGADGYMLKGQEIEDLVAAIRFMQERGFYHNPNMETLKPFVPQKRRQTVELSDIEQAFLRLCVTELPYKQIATVLGVTEKAVDSHRSVLFQRLGVKSRTGLALYAYQIGLLPFGYKDNEGESSQSPSRI